MAKYETRLTGSFNGLLRTIEKGIPASSMSASYEDGSDWSAGDVSCAVRVYERYSMAGGNRVSMNITLVGKGEDLFLTAITSGGSQALLFKINTLGEETFLNCLIDIVEGYDVRR